MVSTICAVIAVILEMFIILAGYDSAYRTGFDAGLDEGFLKGYDVGFNDGTKCKKAEKHETEL